MSVLKSIKDRANAMSSIKKVTKVMQIISVVKSSKAKEHLNTSNKNKDLCTDIMQKTISSCNFKSSKYYNTFTANQNNSEVVLICISSSKGMCGSINNETAKKTISITKQNPNQKFKIICFGDKSYNFIKSKQQELSNASLDLIPKFDENKIDLNIIYKFFQKVIDQYVEHKIQELHIVAPFLKSLATQIPVSHKILPIENIEPKSETFFNYNEESINSTILSYIHSCITNIFTNASSAINTSRMLAMDNATKNSDTKIKELNLYYNSKRQAKITTELIDVVSGSLSA